MADKRNAEGTGTDDVKDNQMLKKLKSCLSLYPGRSLDVDADGTPLAMERMKDWRDRLLFRCDWTQAADSSLSDSDKAEWATYRQALRDMPTTQNPKIVTVSGARRNGGLDFTSFTFPTSPTGDIL